MCIRDRAYAVILPGTAPLEEIQRQRPTALVLSGGPASVFDPTSLHPDPNVLNLGLPTLGICYGMQLLVHHFGGEVKQADRREYGRAHLTRYNGRLFAGMSGKLQVWMSHADSVIRLPSGWRTVASSEHNPVSAIESADGRTVGVQFHPEVVHTPQGMPILENFLDIARVPRDWTPEHTLDVLQQEVREQTGDARVLLAASGGVDSSALALLLAKAGVDHSAIFVDHGLLRLGEREKVEKALSDAGVNLVTVDATDRFIRGLKGITDPETKRKIIGREFIAVFEDTAREIGPFAHLAQGTLYPDVIESAGSQAAAVIKSHHNVGGLPETLGFRLLEPFRYLFLSLIHI